MYRIGDFTKITETSITTLRYYDDISLFEPDEIDVYTSYRYYSDSKIDEFKLIKELQNVGFSIDEIKKYWNNLNNDIMLRKKDELLKQRKDIESKIKKIDYLRSHIVGGKIVFADVKETIRKKSLLK